MGDLRDLELSRFCSWIWWTLTRNIETEAEQASFEAKLYMPPLDTKKPVESGPWSAEAEMRAFSALRAGLGQGPVVPSEVDEP